MDWGGNIVMEDLRISCIWKIAKRTDSRMKFFDYIQTAHEFCPDEKINESCHYMGLKKSNISREEVDSCVQETFVSKGKETYDKDDNTELKSSLEDWQSFGSHLYPAVSVNGIKFRGQVNPENVFEDICMGFTRMPHACRRFLKKEGIKVQDNGINSNQLVAVLFSVIVLNAILFLNYRNHLNKELSEERKLQVSSEVSKYVALS